jgi:hypothetical protein
LQRIGTENLEGEIALATQVLSTSYEKKGLMQGTKLFGTKVNKVFFLQNSKAKKIYFRQKNYFSKRSGLCLAVFLCGEDTAQGMIFLFCVLNKQF